MTIALVACGDPGVADTPDTTSPPSAVATSTVPPTTSAPRVEEFHQDGLTCDSEEMETAIWDYGGDAVGYETVDEAIESFMAGSDWQLRDDWHDLTPGEMDDLEVDFSDDQGRVRLIVKLIELNGWLIDGHRACSPPS